MIRVRGRLKLRLRVIIRLRDELGVKRPYMGIMHDHMTIDGYYAWSFEGVRVSVTVRPRMGR